MTIPPRSLRDRNPFAKFMVLLVLAVVFALAGVLLAGLLIALGVLMHGVAAAWS